MGKLICDICGGDIAIQVGGRSGKCLVCGALYPIERLREIAASTPQAAPPPSATPVSIGRKADPPSVDLTIEIPVYKPSDSRFMEIENGVLLKYKGDAGYVTIPDGITFIGDGAFCGCSSLTHIIIPSSVTSIGIGAFQDCSALRSVTIPSSVTSIGMSAFQECSALTTVHMLGNVRSMGNTVFADCPKLTAAFWPGCPDFPKFWQKDIFDHTPFGNHLHEYI